MATNKVVYGNQTLMDITDTSATPDGVVEGQIFYAANGTRSVGTLTDATTTTRGLMSAADKIKLDGAYTKPTTGIPATDLASGVIPDISGKANTADLAAIATSGAYSDLINKPQIIAGTGKNAIVINQTSTSRSSGDASVAEGSSTASGNKSHAEGWSTQATATGTHSEGYFSRATSSYAHAENGLYRYGTVYLSGAANATTYTYDITKGYQPTNLDAEMIENKILNYNSTVYYVSAIDLNNHTITVNNSLNKTTALSSASVSFGSFSLADGTLSHAEGNSYAKALGSHAEGFGTISNGQGAHAEGQYTYAHGNGSHAEGINNIASGTASHAEGYYSQAEGAYSHAEGTGIAGGDYSHAENHAYADGDYSHAEGYGASANGDYSHAEGDTTKAVGIGSHAEGLFSIANGNNSHAENGKCNIGTITISGLHNSTEYTYTNSTLSENDLLYINNKMLDNNGERSFISSINTTTKVITTVNTINFDEDLTNTDIDVYAVSYAAGAFSHSEGASYAKETMSHAEGQDTTAVGTASHTEGVKTVAIGLGAHAEGFNTVANHAYQHVFGAYNIPDISINDSDEQGNYIEIVGNGIDENNISNARTLDWAGNEVLAGNLTIGGDEVLTKAQLQTLKGANSSIDNLSGWLAAVSQENVQLKNMIDATDDDFLIGRGFSGTTGTIVTSAIHLITNYIPVLKGQKVAVWYRNTNMLTTGQADYNKIALYDANKNWLQTINIKQTPFTTSEVDFGINGFIRIQIAPADSPISENGLLCFVRNVGWRKNVVYQPSLSAGYSNELYDVIPNNFIAGGGDGSWANQPQRYSQMLRLNHGSKVIFNRDELNLWYVLYDIKADGTRGSWLAEVSGSKATTHSDYNHEITINTDGMDRWILLKVADGINSAKNVNQDYLQHKVTILNRKKIYDIILLMGQSNAGGRGSTNTSHPEEAPSLIFGAGLEYRAISDSTRMYSIVEPFGINENNNNGIDDGSMKTGSMMTSFTNEYFMRTGFPVIGISASKGGTTINQWQPNGALLTDAIARLTACKTFAANNGYTLRHIYMIWCQGESDGDAGTTATSYISQFNTMFAAMRDAGVEKCFLCRIGEYNGSENIDYSEIISAQNTLAQTTPDVIMGTTALAGYRSRGLMKDTFHYYQEAYNEMGRLIADTMAEYQKTGREPMMYDPKYDNLYYSHKN